MGNAEKEAGRMIVVTGATGQYRRRVVEALLKKRPASEIGASVRHTEKASDLAALGVRVSKGDFSDPSELVAAFDGAEQVLYTSWEACGRRANLRSHPTARSPGQCVTTWRRPRQQP